MTRLTTTRRCETLGAPRGLPEPAAPVGYGLVGCGPLERLRAIAERNVAQVERDNARRAAAAAKRERDRAKVRAKLRASQAKANELEKVRAEQQAMRDAARAAAKKVAATAKRGKLKEAWRIEAAAAVARGEPFKSDEAQRAYMGGKRTLDAKGREGEPGGSELVTEAGDEWDGSTPW